MTQASIYNLDHELLVIFGIFLSEYSISKDKHV